MKFKAVSCVRKVIVDYKYKDFLLQKFVVGNLFLHDNEEVLFIDWKGFNMTSWIKIMNPHNGIKMEFFTDEYKIYMPSKTYVFTYPTILNDFISDCERVGLDLYWNTEALDKHFELKTYASAEETEIYYNDLLTKIEKNDVF